MVLSAQMSSIENQAVLYSWANLESEPPVESQCSTMQGFLKFRPLSLPELHGKTGTKQPMFCGQDQALLQHLQSISTLIWKPSENSSPCSGQSIDASQPEHPKKRIGASIAGDTSEPAMSIVRGDLHCRLNWWIVVDQGWMVISQVDYNWDIVQYWNYC